MSKTFLILLAVLALSLAQDAPLYDDKSDIVQLTQSNFDSLVTNTNDLWLIEFYAPWCGHCKAFAPEYKKIARVLRGVIKVGAVDMTKDQAVGSKFGIKGFPTVLLFASRKEQPKPYNGARTIDAVTSFVFEEMKSLVDRRQNPSGKASGKPSESAGAGAKHEEKREDAGSNDAKDVVVLTDSTFESTVKGSNSLWLIEFYAPWCGHCKNLQPHWNSVATRLKGKVSFGKVDATVEKNLAQKYGVNSYPTIKVFLPNGDLDKPIDFEGGRTADAIESAALEYLRKYPAKKEIFQLTGEDVWQKECVGKNGVCVIVFLPHILDSKADGRRKYISVLEDGGKKNVQYPLYYFWAQAYDQKAFERLFNLGSGYPAVVAISYSKKKYAVMRGTYTVEGVASFLSDLMRGYERLYDYTELPKLKDTEKWDGSDPKTELQRNKRT